MSSTQEEVHDDATIMNSRSSLYKNLQRHTTNIGKALTCAICQATYQDPVLLPCVHAYCRSCVTQALKYHGTCPTCKTPTTKRSLVENPLLREMAASYKNVVKSIGMAPVVHDEAFVDMTQNPACTDVPEEEDLELHFKVSKTWQDVLETSGAATFANDALKQQQAAVVAVDRRVLLEQQKREQQQQQDGKPAAVETMKVDEEVETNASDTPADKNQDKKEQEHYVDDDGVVDSNVDSQGNAFVDAKDNASVASDETTLDQHEEEEIQDITTVLANQQLLRHLTTPAADATMTNAADDTCPRNNKSSIQQEDGLNALVPQATSSPTLDNANKDSSTSSITASQRQNSESQAFYTAESEAEDTQGDNDDDTSLTAAKASFKEKKAESGHDGNDLESAAAKTPLTKTLRAEKESPIPKQVVLDQPTEEEDEEVVRATNDKEAALDQKDATLDAAMESPKEAHVPETAKVGDQPMSDAKEGLDVTAPEQSLARSEENEHDAEAEELQASADRNNKEETPAPPDEPMALPSQSVADDRLSQTGEELLSRNEEDQSDAEAGLATSAGRNNKEATVPTVDSTAALPSQAVPACESLSQAEEDEPMPDVEAAESTEEERQSDDPATTTAVAPSTEAEASAPEESAAPTNTEEDEPMPDADSEPETGGPEADVEASDEHQEVESTPPSDTAFGVGTVVQVEDRCWPGINKQGGVGRVTKVHRDGGVISYDVAYVLGGKEKKVEAVFVSEQAPAKKRNRSPKSVDKEKLSPELLASLAADGFDTEGKVALEQVRQVDVKAGSKRKALNETKNNMPAAHGRKKRQKGTVANATNSKKRMQRGTKPSLPALTDEQKRELADARYVERFHTAESQSVISVVASGLAEHDMTMLQLLCKETRNNDVKVRMAETFNVAKTTLVVAALDAQSTPENPTSRTRTLKIMRATLAGVPVVSTSWIKSCLETGKVIVPSQDMYIRTVPAKATDPLIAANLGASLLAARIHQAADKGNAQLLSNTRVLLCGQYNTAEGSPRKNDIQTLLRESGASILTSVGGAMSKLKKVGDDDASKIVLLCDECPHNDRCGISTGLAKEAKAALERDDNGVLVVNSTWLFDSISCGEMAPPKPFKPRSARARELWKLCAQ